MTTNVCLSPSKSERSSYYLILSELSKHAFFQEGRILSLGQCSPDWGSRILCRVTIGGESEGVEGSSKKEKGLMDMDNSMVITGVMEYKGANW